MYTYIYYVVACGLGGRYDYTTTTVDSKILRYIHVQDELYTLKPSSRSMVVKKLLFFSLFAPVFFFFTCLRLRNA